MLGLIESPDLTSFINGEAPAPSETITAPDSSPSSGQKVITNPDFIAWRRADRLLRGWIKLTQSNYLLWRTQMLGLIKSQDLTSFINGEAPTPSETITAPDSSPSSGQKVITNPDFIAWRRADRLLRRWITGTLNEDSLSLVVGLETSMDVWTTLHDSYAQDLQEREFHLEQKLQLTRKVEDIPQALAAMTISDNQDTAWFPDIGASTHMTGNSVSQFTNDNPCDFEFSNGGFLIKHRDSHKIMMKGSRRGNLYALDDEATPQAFFSNRNKEQRNKFGIGGWGILNPKWLDI
ncbi:hypothetical protein HHK36_019578 [Tetracentron sinense]|uniref:Retrotransposon Copia-like N-terminal domain-containing protein n=1 Tax=Tetracentron sinense TaxID=13715 RepID=A0A835D9A0_TETSI|nr:hypothetical protein HHK36_019578 [Tetracentron sinense]